MTRQIAGSFGLVPATGEPAWFTADAPPLASACGLPPSPALRLPARQGRRSLLAGGGLALAAGGLALVPVEPAAGVRPAALPPASPVPGAGEWALFRQLFVSAEGRVVDTGNGGISHSEGQGIGMLAAASFDDPAGFALLHDWTRRTLRHADDGLHAWRYRPGPAPAVDDANNASDGDVLIALALFVAARRWGRGDYLEAARATATDIGRKLLRQVRGHRILLPGAAGFADAAGYVVNPSYYVFPAFPRFAAELGDPAWDELFADGIGLLRAARFGAWNLPPDWLSVARADGALATAPFRPARFSYDAVRIPLYLAWAGLAREPAALAARQFWRNAPGPPAWTDLRSGLCAPDMQPAGMAAIHAFIASRQDGTPLPPLPSLAIARDYYDAALMLLTRMAALPA